MCISAHWYMCVSFHYAYKKKINFYLNIYSEIILHQFVLLSTTNYIKINVINY